MTKILLLASALAALGACQSWPPLPCPSDSELLVLDESLLEKRRVRSHVNRCSYQPGRWNQRPDRSF